jgi:hypothetical protein
MMAKASERKFRVLARDLKTNDVRQVYRLPATKDKPLRFTRDAKAPGRKALFSKTEANKAVAWAKTKKAAGYATTSKYPFLVLDSDTAWGNANLAEKLNELCRKLQRYGWCGEFKRPAQRQWYFYQGWLARKPGFNLAAACCWKNYPHSWAACGKQPRSNHASGNACDFSILHSGRGGGYTNIGNYRGGRDAMRSLGLCLPVPGESWHIELGSNWRA